jgi:hypothetical protein
VLLVGVAYVLRLKYDQEYDDAETMRRQAAFTEGLGWPINTVQASEWRLRVRKSIRDRLKTAEREPDYYATAQPLGPARLAEMTLESAFYTRHLYVKFRLLVWTAFVVAVLVLFAISVLGLTEFVPSSVDQLIAQAMVTIIPLLLALDLLGWGLRLNRLVATILDIEKDLDQLCEGDAADLPQVLRLVAEYNCQVVSGLPIHNWLFERWHDEIKELWERKRAARKAR